jgi:DNA-binding HxlR family transcriptional regulator
MYEPEWKLVVDQQGVTISSDKFQFRTIGTREPENGLDFVEQVTMNSVEAAYVEAVIAELQSMTRRTYGQYCGLGRALEVIGERWTLLFIRDLCVGPRSLKELCKGFTPVAPAIVAARMRELEYFGVVQQALDEDGETRFRLTAFGRELEGVVIPLSLWGARLLGPLRPEDVRTAESMRMAFKAMFRPEAAVGLRVSFQLNLGGDLVVHAQIDDGTIETGEGPLPGVDLVLDELDTALLPLLTGELTAAEAIESGSVKTIGDAALLKTFTELFQIAPMPADT